VEEVDVKSDLATVRIPAKDLPVMPLGESSTVRPGEFVIAMGSPLSLSNTITTGVVSTPARLRAELGLRDRDVPEYIQTDAAITFGNSGGPLVNLDGEAIGINSMKVTPGISFAIPIDYAKKFLKRSEEATKARGRRGLPPSRRYVGITMLTINPQIVEELRARLEMPAGVKSGIVIFRVIRGSPADKAGLLPGDIVTHINSAVVHGSNDVYKHLEGEDVVLRMRVCRKAKFLDVNVRPEQPGEGR
jgi:HtrA serine peptidase 2